MAKHSKKKKSEEKPAVKEVKQNGWTLDTVHEFLRSWKGFLLFAVVGIIILGSLQAPFALGKKTPGGVDVVASLGKSHQIIEYRKATGQDPYWNPYVFGGMPFYHLIEPKAISLDTIIKHMRIILHPDIWLYVFGGMALFGLLLYLGIAPLYSFLLALMIFIWPHIHALIVVGHFMKFRALMFLPLVILTFLYSVRKTSVLGMGLFALSLTFQMRTQHYQIVFYTLLMAFFIGLMFLIQWIRDKNYSLIGKYAAFLTLALVLIVLSIAQPTLVTREYAAYSTRGGRAIHLTEKKDALSKKGVGIDYAVRWSLAPSELLDLVIPRFHGGTSTELYDGKAVPQWRGQKLPLYWGQMPFTQSYEYMGLILILLALMGIVTGWRSSVEVKGLAITLGVSILLAFGRHLIGFYKLFFNHVPYFDKFRVPMMIVTLIFFLLILLAGFGIKYLEEKAFKEKQYGLIYKILGFGFLILMFALIYKSMASFVTAQEVGQYQQSVLKALQDVRAEIATRGLVNAFLFMFLFSISIILIIRNKLHVGMGIALLLILQLFDVYPMASRYMHEHAEYKDVKALERSAFAKTQLEQTLLKDTDYYRIYPFGPLFQSNTWSYYFASIGGYDAAKLQTIQNIIENNLNVPVDGKVPINWNILQLLNVKYVFLPREYAVDDLEKIVSDPAKGVIAYRYKNWKKRIFPVRKVLRVQDEAEILKALNRSDFSVDSLAYVTESFETTISYPDSFSFKINFYTPNKFEADVYSSSDAFVIVSEMWYPRWKAELDGNEIHIYKTDHAVRGIVIPKGKHQLKMYFDDSTFKRAVMFSWFGFIGMYLMIFTGLFFRLKKER